MAVHTIRKGLDLPLAGAPEQRIETAAAPRQVALLGADTLGLRPALAVQPGDRVQRGQLLYGDRRSPGVRYTSPATGTVNGIHRGDRRAFISMVIDVAADDAPETQVLFESLPSPGRVPTDTAAVRAVLLESGLWGALRTRPFSRVPAADAVPQAIFVTAIDTHPHAPDPKVVLAGREADFAAGMAAIEQLAPVPVYLCRGVGSGIAAGPGSRAEVHEFSGPHPAGTPGLHIHLLHPVDSDRMVWHIGYQDVAAIGHLFLTGRLDLERVVSLAGPAVLKPRLLRVRQGAALGELTAGELASGTLRLLSGSVLDGRIAAGEQAGFLGRHHRQVSVLHEGHERELFGWITPQKEKFSVWNVVLGRFGGGRGLPLTTTTNGGERAMVPIGSYERVMPLDLMPTFLLRALVIGDVVRAQTLGCMELDEEDLALCTFVSPGKGEYGPMLRKVLEQIEKEYS
ncbi:MAG: Na(+)-translocating NADH-quinone reductase subunit A [Rubrivivax sp.]|nr:Na(+)-translocating NADH-quinone reductase subunit A [Rubrivivax sp.]